MPLPHGSAEEVAGVAVQPLADAGEALALDETPAFAHSEAMPKDAETLRTLGDLGAALAPDEAPAFAHSEAVTKEAESLHALGDAAEFEWSANQTVEAAISALELAAVGQEAQQPSAPELGTLPDGDLS